jgi:hypothetical protein
MAVPTPPDRPVYRAVVTILEAAFSYMLWSMWNKKIMYGFPTFRESHWLPSAFTYRGLCGHNPLYEPIKINPEETSEQWSEIYREKKERQREYKRAWSKSPHAKAYDKRRTKRTPRKKAREQEIIASKLHYCSVCDASFASVTNLQRHNSSKKHQDRTKGHQEEIHHCAPCRISFKKLSDLNRHKKTKRHIKKTSC